MTVLYDQKKKLPLSGEKGTFCCSLQELLSIYVIFAFTFIMFILFFVLVFVRHLDLLGFDLSVALSCMWFVDVDYQQFEVLFSFSLCIRYFLVCACACACYLDSKFYVIYLYSSHVKMLFLALHCVICLPQVMHSLITS